MISDHLAICLLNYNQDKFILSALAGVLSQDYRPLDIIISDDCSTDGSDRLMEAELTRRFGAATAPLGDCEWRAEQGALRVLLHRNPVNLGIFQNTLQLAKLTTAELLVKADGDDVSHPDRVSRIASAWFAEGKAASVVAHQGWKIDSQNNRVGEFNGVSVEWPRGAMMAFRRDCLEGFAAPVVPHLMVDDEVLSRRGRMIGSGLTMPDRLVDYRVDSGVSSSAGSARKSFVAFAPTLRLGFEQTAADVAAFSRTGKVSSELLAAFAREREILETMFALYGGKTMRERWRALKRSDRPARTNPYYWMQLAMVLPLPVGNSLLAAYDALNRLRKGVVRSQIRLSRSTSTEDEKSSR